MEYELGVIHGFGESDTTQRETTHMKRGGGERTDDGGVISI